MSTNRWVQNCRRSWLFSRGLVVAKLGIEAWLLLALCAATASAAARTGPVIEPDPELQPLVVKLAESGRSDIAKYEAAIALREWAQARQDGSRQVVLQALLLESRTGRDALADARWLIVNEIYMLHVMLPYRDSADAKLRTLVRARLQMDEHTPTDELPQDDLVVSTFLREIDLSRDEPPWDLARAAFDKAPSAAIVHLVRRWTAREAGGETVRRTVLWAEHIVNLTVWRGRMGMLQPGDVEQARAELGNLSQADQWWIRLYVAEMLRRHPALRTDDMLERLRGDANPIVAEAVDRPFHFGMNEEERRHFGTPQW